MGVIFVMVLAFVPTLMAIHYENNCETLPSKIHITKEEYGPTKELVRTCEEDVELAKCEGSCVSSTQPSAMERSGFLKDCKCCRESGYRERTLTLHNCYNGDGHKLGEDWALCKLPSRSRTVVNVTGADQLSLDKHHHQAFHHCPVTSFLSAKFC